MNLSCVKIFFYLTAFQNIIQVNKVFAKVNISIVLHFIKIVAPLTVFVTINSTLSHIYRDICSGSTHCYNTTQWYWAGLGFLMVQCVSFNQHTHTHTFCKYNSISLLFFSSFLFFFASRRKLLTIWLNGHSSNVESGELCKGWANIRTYFEFFFSFFLRQTEVTKKEQSG